MNIRMLPPPIETGKPLHRISQVRKQQDVSLRIVSRRMGIPLSQARDEERQNYDLRISDLLRWGKALGVPVKELVVELDDIPLSVEVAYRAKLVLIAKAAMSLADIVEEESSKILIGKLIQQLTQMMPELNEVRPWHSVGQRRSNEEYRVAAQRTLSEADFRLSLWLVEARSIAGCTPSDNGTGVRLGSVQSSDDRKTAIRTGLCGL